MLKKVIKFLTNRYFLVTAFFLSWIFFFANNDLFTQYQQSEELKGMKERVKFLESEIVRMKAESTLLKTDSAAIEKYAREKYRMKKSNEDIFVFDTIK